MTEISQSKIACLFVDIGGVMLSDGWGHAARALAAKTFGLNAKEMEIRHDQIFDTCELGKFTFEEYLRQAVFYEKRGFTLAEFQQFIFMQSKPDLPMIDLVRKLKPKYGLKIAVVSNEVRELNTYRIRKFKLNSFIDFFISSSFVHLRKPDPDIYRLALDIAQVPAGQVVYIDNISMFTKVAESLGIRSIHHTDYKTTCTKLSSFGLGI
jgi:putative hydrolase of the HAD superfamily